MQKKSLLLTMLLGIALLAGLVSCKGRTSDNMEPLGETVRVVIPTQDIAQDSAVAAGDVEPL